MVVIGYKWKSYALGLGMSTGLRTGLMPMAGTTLITTMGVSLE